MCVIEQCMIQDQDQDTSMCFLKDISLELLGYQLILAGKDSIPLKLLNVSILLQDLMCNYDHYSSQ